MLKAYEPEPDRFEEGTEVTMSGIEEEAISIAKRFENSGLASIVYTDISKDGLLLGPSIDETVNFAKKIKTPVIVSGGISCAEDLMQIKSKESFGIEGVISGRAIYDGRLDIKESNKILSN